MLGGNQVQICNVLVEMPLVFKGVGWRKDIFKCVELLGFI